MDERRTMLLAKVQALPCQEVTSPKLEGEAGRLIAKRSRLKGTPPSPSAREAFPAP
jgi:hypothetical protein